MTDMQTAELTQESLYQPEEMVAPLAWGDIFTAQYEQVKSYGRRMWEKIKFAGTCATAAGVLIAGANIIPSGESSAADAAPIAPGQDVPITGLETNSIAVLNQASIGTGAGWAAIYGEGGYQGTAVTNTGFNGDISTNSAFVNTGSQGKVTVKTGVAAQHQVVDKSLSFPVGPNAEFLPSPIRSFDGRSSGRYIARQVIKVSYGLERANQAAVINMSIDGAVKAGWYAAYPCLDGYKGNASVSVDGTGAQPGTEIVKLDANGDFCAFGIVDAAGIIVDTFGFFKGDVANQLHGAERVLDTRYSAKILSRGQEYIHSLGFENGNKIFVGKLSNDDTQGGPAWLAVYPTEKGYQGTALITPDGKSPTSGLIFGFTDQYGNISIRLGGTAYSTHFIIDEIGLIDPALLGIDISKGIPSPSRVLDTRAFTTPTTTTTSSTTPPTIITNPPSGGNFTIVSNTGYPITADKIQVSCTSGMEFNPFYNKDTPVRKVFVKAVGLVATVGSSQGTYMSTRITNDGTVAEPLYATVADTTGTAQTRDIDDYINTTPGPHYDAVHAKIDVTLDDPNDRGGASYAGNLVLRVDINDCA